MDRLIVETNVLTALGKLAVSQSLATNARMELTNLLDDHELGRVNYDEETLRKINRAMNALEYSEYSINDALYDITDSYFTSQSKG